jgi:hypothetical protein
VATDTLTASEVDLDRLAVDTVRVLATDAIQNAGSGHPGTAMALAPAAYVLWTRFLRFDPSRMSIALSTARCEQECQAQRPLWGQVQVSPASVVAELDAVVGVALEAADEFRLPWLGPPAEIESRHPSNRQQGSGDDDGR